MYPHPHPCFLQVLYNIICYYKLQQSVVRVAKLVICFHLLSLTDSLVPFSHFVSKLWLYVLQDLQALKISEAGSNSQANTQLPVDGLS